MGLVNVLALGYALVIVFAVLGAAVCVVALLCGLLMLTEVFGR